MPLVSKRRSFACRAERLARTGSGPNRSIVWPSGFAQGVRPDANAGEKMALRESCKVAWQDILDISFVNNSVGNMPCLYEFAQPCSGVLVDFVVIRSHDASSPLRCNALNPSAYVYSWREKLTPSFSRAWRRVILFTFRPCALPKLCTHDARLPSLSP